MADSPLSAIDLILSCSVCQATLSSIHREDGQDSGLRRTDDVQSGRIPKLWLTECTHLTCGKHFEGGGVPFHSAEQTPRAPCPVCSVEKNDRSKKDLFYINGTSEGEYDSNIPEAYFKTPPINLGGGSDPAFDALLFQYLSLIRFGSRIHKSAIRSENSLRRWEDKRAEIVRSLSRVAPLREALLAAGRKLFALGQNVSAIELTLKTVGASLAPQQPQAGQQSDPRLSYKASRNDGSVTQVRRQSDVGSRLAQGSATNLSMLSKDFRTFRHQDHESTLDTKEGGSSAKRKRLDVGDEVPRTVTKGAFGKAHSRDLMPPPPAPAELPQTLVHGTDQHNLSDPLRHSGLEEHNKCQYVTTPPRHVLPHATPRKNGFVDRATQEPLNWARVASPCKNGEYVQHSPSVGIQSHQRPQEVPFDQPSYRPPSSFSRPYSHYMQELTQAGSGFTYSRGNHAVNAQEQNYLSPSQQSPCFPRFLRPMATPVSHSNPRIMYQRVSHDGAAAMDTRSVVAPPNTYVDQALCVQHRHPPPTSPSPSRGGHIMLPPPSSSRSSRTASHRLGLSRNARSSSSQFLSSASSFPGSHRQPLGQVSLPSPHSAPAQPNLAYPPSNSGTAISQNNIVVGPMSLNCLTRTHSAGSGSIRRRRAQR